ncbi:MAG: T9SS type A sorting domain-containing protein [Candidatus Marinimicrobia bacterium]|nr:T9SS type A sorting domain-containing protein [Candidatus Neomarinimicrobiota bacterium]
MKIKMLIVLLILGSISFGQVLTLAEARATTVGDTITVAGIVTTPSWSTGYTSYQIQDETAGLNLFYYSAYVPLALGDLVNVTGYIELYNGLTEIIAVDAASIVVISSGNELPASQPLTLTALFSDPEEFESELITIYNVSLTGGTWPADGSSATVQLSDDGGITEVDLRIDSDTDIDGSTEPTWPMVLTGVLSQYDGSAPYDEGYQLMPRALTDIVDQPTGVSTMAEARADSGGTHTVRGFVNTPPFAFSRTDVGFQDATGGLNLYVYGQYMASLGVGDFVEATGLVMDYNGKRELSCTDTTAITILYKGGTVPPPMTMTIAEILADPETSEGMLVKVLNATYSGTWPTGGGSFNLIDPTDTIAVYIDSDQSISGMTPPVGTFNLTGWLGQYISHQIMPRYVSDVETFENQAPVIVNVTYVPQPVYDMDDVTITAEIADDGTVTATLNYDVGAGVVSATMTYTSGDLYTAIIPGQSAGTMVEYSVSADDGSLVTDSDSFTYLVLAAAGQSIPIRSVQYSLTGPSPLDGQEVTITGIVTAEFWGSSSNRYLYVQDSTAAWSGIYVFEYGGWDGFDFNAASGIVHTIAEGDSVSLTGTVTEYYGVTELTDVTAATIYGEGSVPEPIVVTSGQVKTGGTDQEAYEGVLVKVENVTVAEAANSYGEWLITDGTDTLMVDDTWDYYFWPKVGDVLTEIVGVMDYSYDEARLQPRLARDVVESDICRIQRIQQVLYSDLLKTGRIGSAGTIDHTSDMSYMNINPGVDTSYVTIEGVVIMPSELGYAGAGVKVIYQDEHGGPWSGILSYDPDSSAFPVLWEGDTVQVTGYISEYATDHGNMTELFATDVPNVLGFGTGEHGVGVPDPIVVTTGDLRWPETAEQWGNVIVQLNDLTVTDVQTSNTNDGMFSVTDGTGEVWIDHDSWVLFDWWELVGPPEVGTQIDSIYGWIYHHFGDYSDEGVSTYKVVPLYTEDIYFHNVAVGDETTLPDKFALHQNYPNPFNPTTQIQFEVATSGKVRLVVYDVSGRYVRTLVNDDMPSGRYNVVWDGKNNSNQMVSTGVYFVRMISEDFVSVKKMTLLR